MAGFHAVYIELAIMLYIKYVGIFQFQVRPELDILAYI